MPIREIALTARTLFGTNTKVTLVEEGGNFFLEDRQVFGVLDLSLELFGKLGANSPIQLLTECKVGILDPNMTLETLFAEGLAEMTLQYISGADKDFYIANCQEYHNKNKKLSDFYSKEQLGIMLVEITNDERHSNSIDILRRFSDFLMHISIDTRNNDPFFNQLFPDNYSNTFLKLVTILKNEPISEYHPENIFACIDIIDQSLEIYKQLPEDIESNETLCLDLGVRKSELFESFPKSIKNDAHFYIEAANLCEGIIEYMPGAIGGTAEMKSILGRSFTSSNNPELATINRVGILFEGKKIGGYEY
tara:strand:- start:13418 stop:14338 length:921 start_codon:yes stop_codon:yes gene_type:complete